MRSKEGDRREVWKTVNLEMMNNKSKCYRICINRLQYLLKSSNAVSIITINWIAIHQNLNVF